jgi:DNA recombination protein RmuC
MPAMDPVWTVLAGLLVGGSVAVALAFRRRALEAEDAVARAAERAEALGAEVRGLAEDRTRLEVELGAERRVAAERAAEALRTREAVRAEVEKLAGRVLDEKGDALLTRSEERLAAALAPVGEKLKEFEARIERTYGEEGRDRAGLLRELRLLQQAQQALSRQADGLSRALTGDTKVQGDWGELVLERVLETAGLTEGREYDLQITRVDEEGGRRRPDALVYLPGDRAIVVDAKCSLTAFAEAMRAAEPAAREAALDRHLASVRGHVRVLAGKSYAELLAQRTLDLVLLFVPSEAAFHAVVARAPGVYEEAFRQGVVLTSPTTLLAALRLVAHVWRSERQNVNAQRIAEEAGRLLDKLSDFVGDLDAAGARLEQAQQSLAAARGKLHTGRGNALRKAAEIARLGARVKQDKLAPLLRAAGGDDDEEGPDAASEEPAASAVAPAR